MRELELFDEEGNDGTVFRDVIMLALLGFVTIVVLLLPHLNPPAKAIETTAPPGNIVIEARWPDEVDVDVDLWVEAPGDKPVGYSNKGGRTFNLLRDDLGVTRDITGLNYEVAFSRGTPAGEYTVNLHLYRNAKKIPSIPVTVAVSLKPDPNSQMEPIADKKVELSREGEEKTVVRFSIDANGKFIPGSINTLQKKLRAAIK